MGLASWEPKVQANERMSNGFQIMGRKNKRKPGVSMILAHFEQLEKTNVFAMVLPSWEPKAWENKRFLNGFSFLGDP